MAMPVRHVLIASQARLSIGQAFPWPSTNVTCMLCRIGLAPLTLAVSKCHADWSEMVIHCEHVAHQTRVLKLPWIIILRAQVRPYRQHTLTRWQSKSSSVYMHHPL